MKGTAATPQQVQDSILFQAMKKSDTRCKPGQPQNRRASAGREADGRLEQQPNLRTGRARSLKAATVPGKEGRQVQLSRSKKRTVKASAAPKNLDEAISVKLHAVLDGVASPASSDLQKNSGASREGTRRHQQPIEESIATEGPSLSRSSSMNRYKTPTTSGESLASSVDEDFLPSFLHLPAAEPKQRNTQKHGDGRDRLRLSESITELHKLVNAKIEDVIRKKQSMASRIPAAPCKVRPVSARSIAATRIPRAKGVQDTVGDRCLAQDRAGTLVIEAYSPPTSPRQRACVGQGNTAEASTAGHGHSSENELSSGSPSSSAGMRDSTEVGLSRLREDLVAGSIALDGQIDEFRNAHRTIANGELNQTSTDQLLSTFVKGSLQHGSSSLRHGEAAVIPETDALEEFSEEGYSEDDFEDLEDVEEESMMFLQESVSQRDISAQAEALYGSLYQLRNLMTSPQMSRRPTITVEASIPEDLAPEALEQSLSAVHLAKACAVLETALNL